MFETNFWGKMYLIKASGYRTNPKFASWIWLKHETIDSLVEQRLLVCLSILCLYLWWVSGNFPWSLWLLWSFQLLGQCFNTPWLRLHIVLCPVTEIMSSWTSTSDILTEKTCSFWTGNAAKMIYLENTQIVESLSRLKRHLLHFTKAGNLRPDLYHLQLYLIWRFEGSSPTIPAASAFILSYTGVAGDVEDNTKNVTSHNMLDVGSHTSLLHPCLLQSDNGSKIYHRDGTMEASSQYQHHHNLDWWQLIPTPVTTVKL